MNAPVKNRPSESQRLRGLAVVLKIAFAALFLVGGLNHFVRPALYLKIMPPYLPFPQALVYLSGAFEIILGLLLLMPRYTRIAASGLIGLLIAVFPANVYMATHPELSPEAHPLILWLRLPLQGVLVFWAWIYTRRR